jgi:AraC-like DNA-binding protein
MSVPERSERIEWSRPPELPGTEILLAEASRRLWRVYHQTYTIRTCLDSAGTGVEWTYRRKVHYSTARSCMLMEPGELHVTHRLTPPGRVNFRVLMLSPSLVERAAQELNVRPSRPHLKLATQPDPAFFGAFAAFHASLEQPATILERQSRFTTCVRLLLERCTEGLWPFFPARAGRAALERARELIHDRYWENITLDELTTTADMSRFGLVRAFTAAFGLPPHAYQIQVRLARARALLRAALPPAAIAADVGFADQSHLTRHFKRAFGVTPGEYRRASASTQPAGSPDDRPSTCSSSNASGQQ